MRLTAALYPRARFLPNSLELLFFALVALFAATNKQVACLCLTAFDVHELIEFQHAPFATTPPLASLMEDGRTRVMDAALAVAVAVLISRTACSPPAGHAGLERNAGIVVLGFGRWGGRVGTWRRSLRGRPTGRRCRQRFFQRAGLDGCAIGGVRRRGVVHVRVFACGAGRNSEELVKGKDAGFAALPACAIWSALRVGRILASGERSPFCPSWKTGGPGW